MGLPLNVVDCAISSHETELFRWRNPYSGAVRGSPLENTLASNARRNCICRSLRRRRILIHQALLLPSDGVKALGKILPVEKQFDRRKSRRIPRRQYLASLT